MNGKEARLRRLFHHLEGRLLIVPLDHSVSDGPISGNEEYESLTKDISSSGADAIVVHKGRLKQLPAEAFVNSSIIVQLSASTRYARDPNEKVLVCSVEDALMRGADGITVHVNVGSNSEPEQLRDVAQIADVCDRLGVPLLAMMYARGPGIEQTPRLQAIGHAGSLAADLGADLAKLALPAEIDDVHWIVSRCPLPVVASGGPKTDESEFLRYAETVIQGGAIGLAVGRNVFQSKHPGGFVANLRRRIDGASTRGPTSSTTRDAVATARLAMSQYDTSVIIIGAGPVGLNLALFLDRLGVPCVVIDSEKNSRWHPKGSTHNSRTMEHYRWLGISDLIRASGLPAEFPKDVAYFTRGLSWEITRFRLPSERERSRGQKMTAALHQVPEPLLRSNQMYVERCLREYISTRPNIRLRFGWQVVKIIGSDSEVTVTAVSKEDGTPCEWRSPYVVGCDGANSFTRRLLGISYGGRSPDREAFLDGAMVSSHVRIPGFAQALQRRQRAWMYNIISPHARLIMISLDGQDEYLIMSKGQRAGHTPANDEVILEIRKGIGADTPVSVIRSLPWSAGVALIAEKFSRGRILLCGDSCHLFSPTGGYGMNTGIDDARNLSWKLAACLQGWAPPRLLSTYETERKPIAHRNTQAALFLTRRTSSIRVPGNLEEASPTGELSRQELAAVLTPVRSQFTSLGIELGARYDDSPIVLRQDSPPPDVWEEYRPSPVPGGRLPHLWLSEAETPAECNEPPPRVSIYDVLGTGFTLLRVGETAPPGDEFSAAARKLAIPFKIVDLPRAPAIGLYESSLLLVRPDHHIAWRSDRLEQPAEHIFERCLGWKLPPASP